MSAITPVLDQHVPSADITPSRSKLEIVPRRVKFDFSDFDSKFYYHGNSCISAVSYTHLTLPTNREV